MNSVKRIGSSNSFVSGVMGRSMDMLTMMTSSGSGLIESTTGTSLEALAVVTAIAEGRLLLLFFDRLC